LDPEFTVNGLISLAVLITRYGDVREREEDSLPEVGLDLRQGPIEPRLQFPRRFRDFLGVSCEQPRLWITPVNEQTSVDQVEMACVGTCFQYSRPAFLRVLIRIAIRHADRLGLADQHIVQAAQMSPCGHRKLLPQASAPFALQSAARPASVE